MVCRFQKLLTHKDRDIDPSFWVFIKNVPGGLGESQLRTGIAQASGLAMSDVKMVDMRSKKGDLKANPSAYIEFTTQEMAKKVLGLGSFKMTKDDTEFVIGIEERLRPGASRNGGGRKPTPAGPNN